ncbi:hypothetical protein TIFTF001_029732 [Ficus carica]|uniref:Uncharacterized protein n=1 Tax=Ficus carica TaxID=3494 RepID=A0AA88DSI2_FICCA|nr:hypothetical protein TIFTF001_029732 [Ficus carica]
MIGTGYQVSGVRWCRVVGVARPATVQLSAGIEWRDKSSLGRPSPKALSCGRESVTRASILEPDGDMLEVPKGEVVRGSTTKLSSSVPRSLVNRWSPARERLHHQHYAWYGGKEKGNEMGRGKSKGKTMELVVW